MSHSEAPAAAPAAAADPAAGVPLPPGATKPPVVALGWSIFYLEKNRVVYVDNATHASQEEIPPGLAALESDADGWKEVQRGEQAFYVHTETGKKQWSRPSCLPPQEPTAGAAPAAQARPPVPPAAVPVAAVGLPPGVAASRGVLPDESPSKVALAALGAAPAGHQTQLALLSAERNLEADLRRRQEEKNKQLHAVVLQQQEHINKLEMRSTAETVRARERSGSDEPPAHAPPRAPQQLTQEQAFSLAQSICDKAARDGVDGGGERDPKMVAHALHSMYFKGGAGPVDVAAIAAPPPQPQLALEQRPFIAPPEQLQEPPPQAVETAPAAQPAAAAAPRETTLTIDLSPIAKAATRSLRKARKGKGVEGEMLLNFEVAEGHDGAMAVVPVGTAGALPHQAVSPLALQAAAAAAVTGAVGTAEAPQVVDMALNVFHDGKGHVVAVEPGYDANASTPIAQEIIYITSFALPPAECFPRTTRAVLAARSSARCCVRRRRRRRSTRR